MGKHLILEVLHSAIADKQPVADVDLSELNLRGCDLTGLIARGLLAIGTQLDYALLTGAELIEADFTPSQS